LYLFIQPSLPGAEGVSPASKVDPRLTTDIARIDESSLRGRRMEWVGWRNRFSVDVRSSSLA
jgi:hypothetical protein